MRAPVETGDRHAPAPACTVAFGLLRRGSRGVADAAVDAGTGTTCLRGGRGAQAPVGGQGLLLLVALRGRLQVESKDGVFRVRARHFLALPAPHWTSRACGRSERHRRNVVARLLCARNRILNAPFAAHDLRALAAAARYSPSHFLRSFRDVFGMTPRELLAETRLQLARDLIQDGRLAIREVAASVGYESRHAFSRSFKRATGMTATDFRLACGNG